MNSKNWALLAATIVALIYGVTFTIAKDVMPKYVQAFGFITMRVGGTAILFWIIYFFGPKEKIAKKDFTLIISCAFFGVAFNMLTFFKGLSYTSPIMCSVLMVTTPIIVLVLSALIIKEKLSSQKVIGILFGAIGAILLIFYGKASANATYPQLGNFLVFVNAVSYAYYLVLVKKLMNKYNALSFVPYIYTIGFFMVLPFGYQEFNAINWHEIPFDIFIKIGFVVVFSTFVTYLLNLLSMRILSPTIVAVFIYLQPVFATVFAVSLQKDTLSLEKIASMISIFIGVYLVTKKGRIKV
jgi:drug/metabolite transporter (DMT)-like permease